jgi:hypothetical protein
MMRKSGLPTWPPKWTPTRLERDDKPVGEVGILEDVVMSNLIDDKIFLFMHHQSYRYMGSMGFDDRAFCAQIYTLLKANIGRSIKEIGDLDLSHLL